MKIYVTGDVHGDVLQRLSGRNFPVGNKLSREDLVIIAGDFGVIWESQCSKKEKYILNWLNDRPFTTLVVGGNHENWDRLRDLPKIEKFGVTLQEIRPNVFFVPNGTLFDFGGKKIFCMGGAMSTDRGGLDPNKFYPEEGNGWWRDEIPTYEEMDFGTKNLEDVGYEVDTIISHTMPIKNVMMFTMAMGYHEDRTKDPTANYLSFIAEHTKFNQWFCGHFHQNEQYGDITVLYDAIVSI